MRLIQVDPEILIPKTKNARCVTPPDLLSSRACIWGCNRAGEALWKSQQCCLPCWVLGGQPVGVKACSSITYSAPVCTPIIRLIPHSANSLWPVFVEGNRSCRLFLGYIQSSWVDEKWQRHKSPENHAADSEHIINPVPGGRACSRPYISNDILLQVDRTKKKRNTPLQSVPL